MGSYTKYVKKCICSCKCANANEYSGSHEMDGETVAVWKENDYSLSNPKCLCAMVQAEAPVWNVQYHNGKYGWNPLSPGTCNSGISPEHDYTPDGNYYRACFVHDMCMLTSNSQVF